MLTFLLPSPSLPSLRSLHPSLCPSFPPSLPLSPCISSSLSWFFPSIYRSPSYTSIAPCLPASLTSSFVLSPPASLACSSALASSLRGSIRHSLSACLLPENVASESISRTTVSFLADTSAASIQRHLLPPPPCFPCCLRSQHLYPPMHCPFQCWFIH